MVSAAQNDMLIRVGPGTPMGGLMREYWIPALLGSELQAGAPPRRLRLLGEDFVAFRSPGGAAGLMDEACPHRGASMALARNEECGLRCIYHGWQIAADGALVDAPTHPEGTPLDRLPTRSHPVVERQGIVWTWLGSGEPPAFPRLVFTALPDDHVTAAKTQLNCGYLQPLETLWDVFHSQILHNRLNRASARGGVYFSDAGIRRAGDLIFNYPTMLVERTDYGFRYTNVDPAKETTLEYIAPFTLLNTAGPGKDSDQTLQICVPVDDTHCIDWVIFYNRFAPLQPDGLAARALGGVIDRAEYLGDPASRHAGNRWGQDRAAMDAGETYNGVVPSHGLSILAEDALVIESQGAPDRTRESLGPVDRAVVEGRRVLLDAVAAHQRGEAPIARDLDLSRVEPKFVVKEQTVTA